MRRFAEYGPSLIVLATATVVLFVSPLAIRQITFAQGRARAVAASHRLADQPLLQQLNQAYQDIADVVEPSVVHISAEQIVQDRAGRPSLFGSSGSGWIYDHQGHIVTNSHVVLEAQRIQVQTYDGTLREAELVGTDQQTDIAVIRVDPARLQPALPGSSDALRQGDQVFAFGSPFDFRFSMSTGIVSGLGRSAGLADLYYEDFIQVDAAINPGNSGGPLTDIQGRVVGMNTAIATGRGNSSGQGLFAGIGLAIPMSMIRPVVEQIITTGDVDRGYLGVERDMGQALAAARVDGFIGQGFGVAHVVPNGPADQGGLRPGDIITHIDSRAIAAEDANEAFTRLRSLIGTRRPDDKITLRVWRAGEHAAGETLNLTVTLGKLDPQSLARGMPELLRSLGLLDLATCTPAQAAKLGIAHHHGVIIGSIAPGSPYEDRIEPKSIIVSVEGRPVGNIGEFYLRINQILRLTGAVDLGLISPSGAETTLRLSLRLAPAPRPPD